tara:strand:- start:3330 stop:5255 length:1926 start_codon:yes stop_codon:yes gene_type:complete
MKFSYNHILEHLNEEPSIKDVSSKLFQLGHENEILDGIIDVEFTPNRGDCLSLKGITRDLGLFYDRKQNLQIFEDTIEPLDIEFKNYSPDDCHSISFLNIEIDGVISEYEPYLESYFAELNEKKINFFTDISNFIAYEVGQPTHCYDYTKLGSSLSFKKAILNESFITLTDKEIKLTDENCFFQSDDKVINLAGVMGGKSTCCDNSTKNVLIECAFFNPESIIGKSTKYDLNSDAAYKFERGVDHSIIEWTLRRFIHIVSQHATITKLSIYHENNNEQENKLINYDLESVSKTLGMEIQDEAYRDLLDKLGFNIINNNIEIPPHRHDICNQNDLAEEFARFIGYDFIEPKEFKSIKNINEETNNEQILKDFLIDAGFNEVINMPFTSQNSHLSISLDNPIDSNKAYLRTSLKSSLINNLIFNENRQKDSIKLFEISDIYSLQDGLQKDTKIGLIITGRVANNYKDFSKKLDKKYLNSLFKLNNFNLDINLIEEISRDNLKTKSKDKIFYLEIELKKLIQPLLGYIRKKPHIKTFEQRYKTISELPASARDISFVVNDSNLISKLEKLLLNFKSENLKDVFVFDFYENEKTSEIKIGFRFIFQSNTSTLTVETIDREMNEIIKIINKIEGVQIPGLDKMFGK